MLKQFILVTFGLGLVLAENQRQEADQQDGEGVFEVTALYDHEANIVLYKDPTIPACYIQHTQDGRDAASHDILLTGKALNGSRGMLLSRFQKEFCSNLPLFQMENNPDSNHERRRVHRTRRNAGGYGRNYRQDSTRDGQQPNQDQFFWPGSQTQVEGNVNGNGRFSGKAQSTYAGLSQSQIQLGGVGLTGSISSVAGGVQSALRLGARSGSGQISSSGSGPSASDLQLNLGEPGQESRAHAMVMQQHMSSSDPQALEQLQQRFSQGFGFSGYDSTNQQRRTYSNGQTRGRGSQGSFTGGQGSLAFGRQDRTRTQFDGSSTSTVSGDQQSVSRMDQVSSSKNGDTSFIPRRPGQSRGYQQAVQAPQERVGTYTNGGGQGQFQTDSLSVKDFPNQSSFSANGQSNYHTSTVQESEQQAYQNSQVVKMRSQTNGFRVNGRSATSERIPTQEGQTQQPQPAGFQRFPTPIQSAGSLQRVEDSHQESMTLQQPQNGGSYPKGVNGHAQAPEVQEEENETLPGFQPPEATTTATTPQDQNHYEGRRPQAPEETETNILPGVQSPKPNGFQQQPNLKQNGYPQGTTQPQNGHPQGTTQPQNGYPLGPTQPRNGYPPGSTQPQNGYPQGPTQQRNGYPPGSTQPQNGYPQGTIQQQNGYPQETTQSQNGYPQGPAQSQNGYPQGPRQPQNGHPQGPSQPRNGYRQAMQGLSQQYDQSRQDGNMDQEIHETETETSAVFQAPKPNGRTRRPDMSQTQYGGTQTNGRVPDLQETDLSAVFQAPQQNGNGLTPRMDTTQPQNGGGGYRPYTSQVTTSVQHQTEDSVIPMQPKIYTPQRSGEMPMMTSYPVSSGRRVYQRRIVTYYPGQMAPVSQHYVQQSMTGRQPQPQGFTQTQPITTGQGNGSGCHTVTFQCTVIFDSNGKSKLCQPKPVNGNSQQGQQGVCCC